MNPEGGKRHLLEQIAAAVPKESLEPLLHSLAGASLQENRVILDLGQSLSDFLRRQLRDNLAMISEAASSVVGHPVQVQFEDLVPDAPKPQSAADAVRQPAEEDVLEIARREPVVQSFLDAFPGPVKSEKIKP